MRSRFVAGWRGLVLAAAMASLMLLPASAFAASGQAPIESAQSRFSIAPEESQPISQPTLFLRSNYIWPFASGPTYGSVDESRRSASGVLHFSVGSFETSHGFFNLPAELRAGVKLDKLSAQYFVLQLDTNSLVEGSYQALLGAVESNGGAVVSNLAVAGFIARLTPAAYAAVQGVPGLTLVEPYHPALKLSPEIGRAPLPDPAKALSTVYSLSVRIFQGENSQAVAQAIAAMGGNVTAVWADTIQVDFPRERLAQLASIEAVEMVVESSPNFPHGEETTTTMQTGRYNAGAIPFHDVGLDGGGNGLPGTSPQVLMVLDSGIQIDAGDLSNTKTDAGTIGPAHRKVVAYKTTNLFGGQGDLLGCDAPQQGAFTHGHVVAGTALGNATATPLSYGGSWFAYVPTYSLLQWKLDGVAPRAKVAAYDANVTSTTTSCSDPAVSGIFPGNLYDAGNACANPGATSLADAYCNFGAKIINFSWGVQTPGTYSADSQDIDTFLREAPSAMVFISAGNAGADLDYNGIPDPGTVASPATSKNGAVIGASSSANDGGAPFETVRAYFSSVGPATSTSQRVAPILMAPGNDEGNAILGLPSEYVCRTNDNDQSNPVECDIVLGNSGTSFSAPAAAGAAALVRDYFAQGFYPDGTSLNPSNSADQVFDISGALLKAVLITSAQFLDYPGPTLTPSTRNPTKFRFNNQQGYGRIQLNKALPLQTYSTPLGLIVADGGIVGGKNSTSLSGTASAGSNESFTFTVSDTTQEIRIALAWIDGVGDVLVNDLDLELVSPSAKIYYGNYFTDDDNKNLLLDAGEDCGGTAWTTTGLVDSWRWSLPICANSDRDTRNPTEAIFLSPDPKFDGDPAKNQIESGTWTVRVKGTTVVGSQPYALAIVGPVQVGSAAQVEVFRVMAGVDKQVNELPVCNDKVRAVVSEIEDATDPSVGLTTGEIASRASFEVYDSSNVLVDSESGLTFTQVPGTLRFESSLIVLTDGTERDPGNGALDVRDNDVIRIVYRDETSGVPDTNKVRTGSKEVNCRASFAFGGLVFNMFGKNAAVYVSGGCERDARGQFYFDAPDQYMDKGEFIDLQIALRAADTVDLEDAVGSLRAVYVDSDSPATCTPGSTGCADPDRKNNVAISSSIFNVLDSPKTIGLIPYMTKSLPTSTGSAPILTVNFTIQMGSVIPDLINAELLLEISARKSGKPVAGLAVYRTYLNAKQAAIHYSTDYVLGGTSPAIPYSDWNNNESIENPTRFLGDVNFVNDYRFETQSFGDLTRGGTVNTALAAPWNFDTNNGNFTVGVNATSNINVPTAIALWGEDLNFNNVLDAGEDRDPANSVLDLNWSTLGGCGWQTKAPGQLTGGVWHTGRISAPTLANCIVTGTTSGQCQATEVYPGTSALNYWYELLKTPVVSKVNKCTTGAEAGCNGRIDEAGAPVYTVQFTNWEWNMAIDLPDSFLELRWELDTDVAKLNPISLESDNSFFNNVWGAHGAVSAGNAPISNGFPVFADFTGTGAAQSKNGTVGGNHEGDNGCFFETSKSRTASYAFALPKDDDLRNGWCNKPSDPTDKQRLCTVATQATDCPLPDYSGTCVLDPAATTDLYVYRNGPIRNWNLLVVNGWIDGRYYTLEDIYGDSGETFQAAVGMVAFEGSKSQKPASGFGASIDDMMLQWKEFTIANDNEVNCSTSGSCATVDTNAGYFFSGLTAVTITVTDRSTATTPNDCDHNGLYTDPVDDFDCNNNATNDVVVWAYNENEPTGEYVVLDQSAVSGVFVGSLPVSIAFDSPGTLFLQKVGGQQPYVTVQYRDRDDGTGVPCQNSNDPSKWGLVESYSEFSLQSGKIVVTSSRISEIHGDGDGFADTNETVDMYLTFSNKTGFDVTNGVARLASNDPKVDCIIQPAISLGTIPKNTTMEAPQAFRFKIRGDANRSTIEEDFFVSFNVTIGADQFDAALDPQSIVQDLDFNLSGGGTPQTFNESFEIATGYGSFTAMSLDTNIATNALSDGMRCQFNDPDFINSQSFGDPFCYLGFVVLADNTFDWHVHKSGAASPDGGRAFVGSQSLHWGYHQDSGDADYDTYKLSQMDAIRLDQPVNLGYFPATPGNPTLSFKHQISLLDYRNLQYSIFMQGSDHGMVALQLADSAGNGVGVWKKIFPYENIYDIQGANNWINCSFDPVDDGNNEDSYFVPDDPNRLYGPSSGCYPEINFSSIGSTDYRSGYIPGNVGRASDDLVGLQGSINVGTWVESKFNLERFRGRRARIRFRTATFKAEDTVSIVDFGAPPGFIRDDGWYIDDVTITNTMASFAEPSVDTTDNSALPACPANCSLMTASLSATPETLEAPGQVTTIDASASYADACISGSLQFQFWIDGDLDGSAGSAGDTLLRDWTDNAIFIDAPSGSLTFAVKVRCSSNTGCQGEATAAVTVNCPSTGTVVSNTPWIGPLNVSKTGGLLIAEPDQNLTLSWATSQSTDLIRGNLISLRSTLTYTGTVQACMLNNSSATSTTDTTAVVSGQGLYFLARGTGGTYCNVTGTYSSGAAKEKTTRDSQIALDPNACP